MNEPSGSLVNCGVEKRTEIKVIFIVSISDKAVIINEVVLMGKQERLGEDNRACFTVWGLQTIKVFCQCLHIYLGYIIYMHFIFHRKKI